MWQLHPHLAALTGGGNEYGYAWNGLPHPAQWVAMPEGADVRLPFITRSKYDTRRPRRSWINQKYGRYDRDGYIYTSILRMIQSVAALDLVTKHAMYAGSKQLYLTRAADV